MDRHEPLAGFAVGVTADRRGEDQEVLFRKLGADVLLGPTIGTRKVPDPDLLRARTEQLIEEPPDYLIADTGIGIRTWMDCAREWGLDEALRQALSSTRIAARGPKAVGAVTSNGLSTWWRSPSEQLAELIEHLVSAELTGKTIAFQLHGDDAAELVALLEGAGASVTTLPVYVWTEPKDPAPALALIERIIHGEIHAVTFTAGPQVRGLMQLAGTGNRTRLLEQLNTSTVAACIGPVCASAAVREGIVNPAIPANWRLGSLVRLVVEKLAGETEPPAGGSS